MGNGDIGDVASSEPVPPVVVTASEPVPVEPEPVAVVEPEPVAVVEPAPVEVVEPEPEPEPEPAVEPEPVAAPAAATAKLLKPKGRLLSRAFEATGDQRSAITQTLADPGD